MPGHEFIAAPKANGIVEPAESDVTERIPTRTSEKESILAFSSPTDATSVFQVDCLTLFSFDCLVGPLRPPRVYSLTSERVTQNHLTHPSLPTSPAERGFIHPRSLSTSPSHPQHTHLTPGGCPG